jgi:hypothetical protein
MNPASACAFAAAQCPARARRVRLCVPVGESSSGNGGTFQAHIGAALRRSRGHRNGRRPAPATIEIPLLRGPECPLFNGVQAVEVTHAQSDIRRHPQSRPCSRRVPRLSRTHLRTTRHLSRCDMRRGQVGNRMVDTETVVVTSGKHEDSRQAPQQRSNNPLINSERKSAAEAAPCLDRCGLNRDRR